MHLTRGKYNIHASSSMGRCRTCTCNTSTLVSAVDNHTYRFLSNITLSNSRYVWIFPGTQHSPFLLNQFHLPHGWLDNNCPRQYIHPATFVSKQVVKPPKKTLFPAGSDSALSRGGKSCFDIITPTDLFLIKSPQ